MEEVVVVKEVRYTDCFIPSNEILHGAKCMYPMSCSGWVDTELTVWGAATEHQCTAVSPQIAQR